MTRSGLGNSLVFGEGKIYWLWDSLESMRIILIKYMEGPCETIDTLITVRIGLLSGSGRDGPEL